MSLNQLTETYTDSENDDVEENIKNISLSSDDGPSSEYKESNKNNPGNFYSRESTTDNPKKHIGGLVSYVNEEEDDDDEDDPSLDKYDLGASDELISEPMDTGSDDGDDDKPKTIRDLGIKLPSAPPGKCSTQLQDKVSHFVNRMRHGNMDWNQKIQNNKAFRNPSIYEKLIHHLGLDEMGSNYPLNMFDPHCWGKESYYDELSKIQKEEMDRREKERREKTKVDIISGTKKPSEEEAKKRKSRFDQALPPSAASVPTLTSVPSGNKTTISAFGSLKKTK